jgi:hypothetical protein
VADVSEHGTRGKYVNDKCRCDACRKANAEYGEYMLHQRQTRSRIPDIPHGVGRYQNWGCRCGVCTEAKSRANADYSRRRLAAKSAG